MVTIKKASDNDALAKIMSICNRHGLPCKILSDVAGIIATIIDIKIPAQVPRQGSKKLADEQLVQYCHDQELKYEITTNTIKNTLIPTDIRIRIGKGRAFDGIERMMVREHVENGLPFQVCVAGGYHHYNFGPNSRTFHYDVMRSVDKRYFPNIIDMPYIPLEKTEEKVKPLPKTSLWTRIKSCFKKKPKIKEVIITLDPDALRLAGIKK